MKTRYNCKRKVFTECACPYGGHVGFLVGKWAVGCGWANMCENKWGPTGNI